MTTRTATRTTRLRVTLALLVLAVSTLVTGADPAWSAPTPGSGARLHLSATPVETPAVITPQAGWSVTLSIGNDGTEPSPEMSLSQAITSPPGAPGGGVPYVLVDDDVNLYWSIVDASNTWVGSCETTTCTLPPIPVGETWTVHLDYWVGSAPLHWRNPLYGFVHEIPAGQAMRAQFDLEFASYVPGDPDSVPTDLLAACVTCHASIGAVIGDFAMFNTTLATTALPGTVAAPGTNETVTLSIGNDGTTSSEWYGQLRFGTGVDDDLAWPVGVDSINGVGRGDLHSGWNDLDLPGTPCVLVGVPLDFDLECRATGPLSPGAHLDIPFTLTYADPGPDGPEPGANFTGTITASVYSSSSNDHSNCDSYDNPLHDGCTSTLPYRIVADQHIEAVNITPTPNPAPTDGTLEWSVTYRNGGDLGTLRAEQNRVLIPVADNQTVTGWSPDWTCTTPRPPTDASGYYTLIECAPSSPRPLAAGDTETFTVTTRLQLGANGQTWLAAWDWRAEASTVNEDGSIHLACEPGPGPQTRNLVGGVGMNLPATTNGIVPPNITDCGIVATVPIGVAPPPASHLTIVKEASETVVRPGESFTWSLTVVNDGQGDASSVVVTDELPEGVTVQTPPAGCDLAGRTITCTFGDLASGVTHTIDLEVRVDDPVPSAVVASGELVNIGVVTDEGGNCPTEDPAPECSDTSIVQVELPSHLTIVKEASETVVRTGDSFTWSLTVVNDGQGDASSVVVTDELPEGVTVQTPPAGCDLAGRTITCTFGDLASGVTHTIDLDVRVDDPVPSAVVASGELVNIGVVTDEGGNCPTEDPAPECSDTSIVQVELPDEPVDPALPDDPDPTGPPPTVTVPESPEGPLPRTGAAVWIELLAGGVALLAGSGLVLGGRRRPPRLEGE